MYSLLLTLAICSTVSAFSVIQPQLSPSIQHQQHQQKHQQKHQQHSHSEKSYCIYPNLRSNRKSTLFAADIEDSTSEAKAEDSNKTSTNSSSSSNSSKEITTSNDDVDEEWEYVEYEMLKESDFYNSEWKVGTVMDGSNKIVETWTRLIVQDGEFICVWGDGSNGKWNFDVSSQFLSMSKDTIGGWLGKKIWAGTIDDYYYVQGTIRGWSPISPASVVGQWQAKRLGVDKDEAGIAPWFEDDEDDDTEGGSGTLEQSS